MIAAAYLVLPVLLEDAETTMASVPALAVRGGPIYPGPGDPGRYVLLYGPLAFLIRAAFYPIFGFTLFSFKLVSFVALLISLLGLYRICRKYAPETEALTGVGAAALVFFRYLPAMIWGRCDPLILCATVLSVWASLGESAFVAVVGNGLALACIANLKISGVAYAIPLLTLLLLRRGWRAGAITVGLAVVFVIAPFFLPQVSFVNYAMVLRQAGRHGFVGELLLRNLQYSLILLLPVLLYIRRFSREQRFYLGSIVLGLLLSSIAGGKAGAGSYHLLPYTVPILHLFFWARGNEGGAFSRYAPAWTLTLLLFSVKQVRDVVSSFSFVKSGYEAISEIRSVERSHPGQTVEVGVGQNYEDPRQWYGYVTTFDGQPYTIGYAAQRDLQFGHVPIPRATNDYLSGCGTQVWLIPKGTLPFAATNTYYTTYHPAFDESFRQAFLAHYRKTGSGALYDVWTCLAGR